MNNKNNESTANACGNKYNDNRNYKNINKNHNDDNSNNNNN